MTVVVEQQGPVRVITIDRPEVRNAVDGPTARLLYEAFVAADTDEDGTPDWDDADSERQTHQDQSGRLWDLLFMAAHAARANANAGSELLFELYRVPRDGRATEAEFTTLKLVVGPGDKGEPVTTILLPNED